jgi:DNA modification methylase
MLTSEGRDKDEHEWGQGEAGVTALIDALTEPGELIVDPFAGSGLWGRIAAARKRRWIGCDVVQGGGTETVI